MNRTQIWREVLEERSFQDREWGAVKERHLPLTVWLAVIFEEIGEIAQAVLKHDRENLKIELIQTVAVLVAMLECFEDAPWGVNDKDAG